MELHDDFDRELTPKEEKEKSLQEAIAEAGPDEYRFLSERMQRDHFKTLCQTFTNGKRLDSEYYLIFLSHLLRAGHEVQNKLAARLKAKQAKALSAK